MVELLAKDQFVDALPDEDMRLRIRQNKPGTLRDALKLALELESYQMASRQKAKPVREAYMEEKHSVQRLAGGSRRDTQLPDLVRQLVDALKSDGKGGSNQQKSPGSQASSLVNILSCCALQIDRQSSGKECAHPSPTTGRFPTGKLPSSLHLVV